MKTRVIAAAVLLPILLVIVLAAPKIVTAVLFGVMAAIAAYELLYGTALVRHVRLVIYSMIAAFCVTIWSYFGCSHAYGVLGMTLFFAVLFAEMMISHIKIRFEKICLCLCAGLMIPFLFSSLIRIHGMVLGRYYIMVPFIAAFLSDSGAYFAGSALGQHKLAPVISPHKTIEGVIGGVFSAVVGMLIFAVILQLFFKLRVNYGFAVIYGLLCSMGGVFGDLCFSVIKRQTGVKDYGNVIPGHGGILDRFDSMMIVGPLSEALLILIPIAVK